MRALRRLVRRARFLFRPRVATTLIINGKPWRLT